MNNKLQYTREAKRDIENLLYAGDDIPLSLVVEITILDREPESFTGTDMELETSLDDLDKNLYKELFPYSEPSSKMLDLVWITSVKLAPKAVNPPQQGEMRI